MKGQGELEWPVWRGRFKVKANSSGLYGDKGKIMSTENSPWEGITESWIRLPHCCFWLLLTAPCARMIGPRVSMMTRAHSERPAQPNLDNVPPHRLLSNKSSTLLNCWYYSPPWNSLLIVFTLFCWFELFNEGFFFRRSVRTEGWRCHYHLLFFFFPSAWAYRNPLRL